MANSRLLTSTALLFSALLFLSRSTLAQLDSVTLAPLATSLLDDIQSTGPSTLATSVIFSETSSDFLPEPTEFLSDEDDGDDGFSEHEQNRQRATLLNYYFVFLALLGVMVAVGVYLIARRRRKRKLEHRSDGQNALARDLTGWPAGPGRRRRWVHGTAIFQGQPQQPPREEGLNEHGEAPPPYAPKAPEETNEQPGSHGAHTAAGSLSIPLQTLSRDGRSTMKPPEYDDALGTSVRSASIEEVSRPTTAGGASTREILR